MLIDAQIGSTQITTTNFPMWDLIVSSGIIPLIQGDNVNQQIAMVAAFEQLGTLPVLSGIGVDWLGWLTGQITFGQLDGQIRYQINNSGVNGYIPNYGLDNGQMVVTITKAGY